jgi:hypothetical protein
MLGLPEAKWQDREEGQEQEQGQERYRARDSKQSTLSELKASNPRFHAMYVCACSNTLLSSMDNDIPIISLNCIALTTAFAP